MPEYMGFANWGTWNLTNIVWGDLEEELALCLQAIEQATDSGSAAAWDGDGAAYLRERIEELASYEPADGPLRTTLWREGTDNIDWDALAIYWRKEA
jgi:hypothetical protein